MKTETKIKNLNLLIDDLVKDGEQFNGTINDCPLRDDHWRLSKIINGVECYEWECPFCGEIESV